MTCERLIAKNGTLGKKVRLGAKAAGPPVGL